MALTECSIGASELDLMGTDHFSVLILGNQIYRSRSGGAFYQQHGIRLGGPSLRWPRKDHELVGAEKKQIIEEQRQKNAIKGKQD